MKKLLKPVIIGTLTTLIILQAFQPTLVSGNSMDPYIKDGDFLITKKWDKTPNYEDIVVFKYKGANIIKRVIGKPGDSIRFQDDKIYVNDDPRTEDITCITEPGFDVTLGDDEYYVLGDNRPHSIDSRTIGPIKKEDISGIAFVRILGGLGRI